MLAQWIRAARPQLFTIGFTPLVLGNVVAWYEHGFFSWPRFILSLIIGFLIHLVSAFANDVADIGTDKANLSRTPFSGGSGVLVEGRLLPADLIRGACLAGVGVIVLTVLLIFGFHVHSGIVFFVGWGILSATQYSLPPLKFSYHGGGEFLVLVTYSAALVGAGYFVQAGSIHSPLVWSLSIPIGLAVFSLIAITQFPDLEADKMAGKHSLVIMLGIRKTLRIISLAVSFSAVSMIFFLFMGLVPFWAGIFSLLCLPLAYQLLKMMLLSAEEGIAMYTKASKGTLLLTVWYGLAPAFGLLANKWLLMPG